MRVASGLVRSELMLPLMCNLSRSLICAVNVLSGVMVIVTVDVQDDMCSQRAFYRDEHHDS